MCGNHISRDNDIFQDKNFKDALKKICHEFLYHEKDDLYRIKAWFSIIEIHQEREENPELSIYINTSKQFEHEGVYNIGYHQNLDNVISKYEHGSFYGNPNPEYNGFAEFIKKNSGHNYITCDSYKCNYNAMIFTDDEFIKIVNNNINNLDFYQFSIGEILELEPLSKKDFSKNIEIQTRGGFTGWNWSKLKE
jgi:hypothetical protein